MEIQASLNGVRPGLTERSRPSRVAGEEASKLLDEVAKLKKQ